MVEAHTGSETTIIFVSNLELRCKDTVKNHRQSSKLVKKTSQNQTSDVGQCYRSLSLGASGLKKTITSLKPGGVVVVRAVAVNEPGLQTDLTKAFCNFRGRYVLWCNERLCMARRDCNGEGQNAKV